MPCAGPRIEEAEPRVKLPLICWGIALHGLVQPGEPVEWSLWVQKGLGQLREEKAGGPTNKKISIRP